MTEPLHTHPVPGAELHDRRGALALGILGLIGLGVSSWYAFTQVESYDMWKGTMAMGFSSALLVAAVLRGGYGRTLETGPVLVSFHKEIGGYVHYKVLQFVSLTIDAALCFVVAGALLEFLDQAQEILGSIAATGLCGLIIFVPAAWWGATPGMLICGLRWLRTKDGHRVGALHAFLRFLAMGLFAAPQAAIMVLGTVFGVWKVRGYPGGKLYRNKTIRNATWKSRRTLADLACRTETLRPSTYT